MSSNIRRVTKTEMEAMSNMAEDTCAEPTCGMTIWVDKDLKEQGRKSKCMPCLVRAKFPRNKQ